MSILAATGADLSGDRDSAARAEAEAGLLPSYLVSYTSNGSGRCPARAGLDVIHLRTGARWPASCNTYGCSTWCGPRKGWALGQLAAASAPERFMTLTRAVEDFQTNRRWVKKLADRLRRRGYDVDWFWAVEENPRGTGFHIHLLQRGQYIPQRLLERLWGAIVGIERIRVEVDASKYVIKGAASSNYVTKGIAADFTRHLALNGGRVAHHTRGYMRLDNGEPATATAIRIARGRAATPGPLRLIAAHTAVGAEFLRRLAMAEVMERRVVRT